MNLFFFQAEDGIRDGHVTGVQTCALPISPSIAQVLAVRSVFSVWGYRLIPSRIVSGSPVEVGALAAAFAFFPSRAARSFSRLAASCFSSSESIFVGRLRSSPTGAERSGEHT